MKFPSRTIELPRRRGRWFSLTVGALLCLSLVPTAMAGSGSAVHWVDDDGTSGPDGCRGTAVAHTAIQSAINASDVNDFVNVCPGKYVGSVAIIGEQHNGLTLRSMQEGAATIKAHEGDGVLVRVLNANRVRVVGFRLAAPTVEPCSELGYMVRVDGSRGVEIRDNDMRATGTDTLGDCQFVFGVGIFSSSAVVQGNLIKDFWLIGILVTNDSNVEIIDNAIRYYHVHEAANAVFAGIGMRIIGSSGTVFGNTIVGLSSGGSTTVPMSTGISVEDTTPGRMVLRDNVIRRTHFGLQLRTTGALVRDNVSLENFGSDCFDDSTGGSGTAGTRNTWIGNLGDPAKSNPAGSLRTSLTCEAHRPALTRC